jgi:hypothetical protein
VEAKKVSANEINGDDDHDAVATCILPAPDRKMRCESDRARRLAPAKNIQEDRLTVPPRPALLVPAAAGVVGGGMPRIVETPIVAADTNSNAHTMMMRSERRRC